MLVLLTITAAPLGRTVFDGASPDWAAGWIVFVDGGTAGARDEGDEIVQVHNALSGSGALQASGNVADYVSYLGNGQSRTADGVAQDGSFSLCGSSDAVKRRRLTLTPGTGFVGVVSLPGARTCTS